MLGRTRVPVKRRELSGALVTAIVCALWQRRAFASGLDGAATDWVARIHELGHALRTNAIEAAEWGDAMEALAASIDLDDVLARTDFERVAARMRLPDRGAGVHRIRLPGVDGPVVKMFGLRRGRALVPHGHDGIASLHLVVHGRLHGRHWDRIDDGSDHLLVRPTEGRSYERGDASTATRDRDNVHWLHAETDLAFAFGVAVEGLDPTRPSRRVYVDPERATVEDGGLLRMPVIDRAVAMRRYGRD